MVKIWFASKFLRTKDPLSQPVIYITLALTCFGTVVFGLVSKEVGAHFAKSKPFLFTKAASRVDIDLKFPGFTDHTKLRAWELDGLSFLLFVFNGTHYLPINSYGILRDSCKPTRLITNPAAFSFLGHYGMWFLHKCDLTRSSNFVGHCIVKFMFPSVPCEKSIPAPVSYGLSINQLKDVGSPLGLHSVGGYIYAYLVLASDNATVSVTRACSYHWAKETLRGVNSNFAAILKLKNCANSSSFPIFVNVFRASKYLAIGYRDNGGSIHLCIHNFTLIDKQFDSIREQCDKETKSPSIWQISSKGRDVKRCVYSDRDNSCGSSNFYENEIIYYNISATYGALYFKLDGILVTPENPILDTFEFQTEWPYIKSTLLISQKNNVIIIHGLEDIDKNINPNVINIDLSLDYIDPFKDVIYLYRPGTSISFIPHNIYSCESLPQHQCVLTPECQTCGLECKSQGNFICPNRKKIAPSSVINPLILSNGILEIVFNPNGTIININVTLETPYDNFIHINASYIPTTGRIRCKLNSYNNSIVFPFFKTVNLFLTISLSAISQTSLSWSEYFQLMDIVQLGDPLLEPTSPDAILIDHPSNISFKFERIASKHIDTVRVILHNYTFGCSSFKKVFKCSLTFPSGIYWPGYASIFVADSFFKSFPLQLNPYPIFNKTVWYNFPGYSVPFHFSGQYFSSFKNLKLNIKLVNITKPIPINCTINSDTDLYCKFDKFPGKLPVSGNFIFYSHSSALTKLPNLSVNLNLPPAITSAVYSKDEKAIRVSISNYFDDYLTNTSISVTQCNISCSEVPCGQIVFNSIQNILTCKMETKYSNKSSEWLAMVTIGLHRLNIVVADEPEKKEEKPKIISSFKFTIYTLLALILLFILALGIYKLRKEIDRLRSVALSNKLSDAQQKGSRKVTSMSRLNSDSKIMPFRPFDSRESNVNEMLTNQFAFFTKRV